MKERALLTMKSHIFKAASECYAELMQEGATDSEFNEIETLFDEIEKEFNAKYGLENE